MLHVYQFVTSKTSYFRLPLRRAHSPESLGEACSVLTSGKCKIKCVPFFNEITDMGVFLKKVVFHWDQPFRVGCWVFLFSNGEKDRFWLVWLINFFNQLRT